MRAIDNWDAIQEQSGDYDNPIPGAYIAVITHVEDVEEKEYLRIEWDYHEGQYKGENYQTFVRAGFWPTTLYRSYKEKALGFFKAFKTCVEASNRGYTFQTSNPYGLKGKLVGVVTGEEEYQKSDGAIGKRLYVSQVRSVDAIRRGDFKIPDLKPLKGTASIPSGSNQFSDLADDDGELPF